MTGTAVRAAPATEPDANLAAALQAARALERWGSARGWVGPDPYDALDARRLPRIARRSPLALRVVTQAVKRSPVNLRPLLAIPNGLSTATLAHVTSAYARNGFMNEDEARGKLRDCVAALAALRCEAFPEACWSYHFDVQTRAFFYPCTRPNTIATAFAGLGLLDAHELAGVDDALELATGAGEFFIRRVPQTKAQPGAYFGYLPGDATPIHNANMLVAALLARLSRVSQREDFRNAASAAVQYTVSRQRPDGAWHYGERPNLSWVDGFHTGYVLDSLLACLGSDIGSEIADEAWRRGLRYYVDALIDPDGAPRYTPGSLYPIDGQCLAQALQTLSLAASTEPELAARRWRVLAYGLRSMRLESGAFVYQRGRVWTNRLAYPRWVQAPLLAGLAHLLTSGCDGEPSSPKPTTPPSIRTSTRMKVLMIGPRDTHPGGITRALTAWVAAGLTEHVDIDAIHTASWDAPLPVQCFQSGVALVALAGRLVRPSHRPDIVHVHTSSGGSLYRKYLASSLADRLGIPVLVHLHSGGFEEWLASRRVHRMTAERLFSLASGVVVLAESWRGLAQQLGASHVHVIPHLLDPRLAEALAPGEAARRVTGGGTRQTTLLYYGRWAPIKGLDVLAAAVTLLPADHQRRLRLRVFGNGDISWVRQCFRDAVLAELSIDGWLADHRKRDELQMADAVIVPSRSEAFGASLLEAMAAGTPIIASRAGAIPEVLADYPLVRLTRLADPADLRDALSALIDNNWPDTSVRMPRLPMRYSAPNVIASLVDTYRLTLRHAGDAHRPADGSGWTPVGA